ncbi:MAG: UbiD family decarboxylase [Nitrososphaerota archaeon]
MRENTQSWRMFLEASIRTFIKKLEDEGKIVKIGKPVSTRFEVASILKKLDPTPVLFEKIVEHPGFRLVGNLCSDRRILAEALDTYTQELKDRLIQAIENPGEKEIVENPPCQEVVVEDPDLTKLPFIWTGTRDRAPYTSASIIIAYDKEYGYNASFHRLMLVDHKRIAPRIVPRHLYNYVERGCREVAITIGNHPAFMLASAVTEDIRIDELSVASSLAKIRYAKTLTNNLLVPAECEVVLEGYVTDEYVDEGPFIDILGTYDIVRKERVIEIRCITMRKNPIFQYILPGGYEHKNLMGLPREATIQREVSKVCECLDVKLTAGSGGWLNAVVKIRKKNDEDGRRAIEAAFRGHESMKYVVVVDEDIDIGNLDEVEWAISTRTQLDRDLVLKPGEKGSSLDPSADQVTRLTCKAGIDATIPSMREKEKFMKATIPEVELERFLD